MEPPNTLIHTEDQWEKPPSHGASPKQAPGSLGLIRYNALMPPAPTHSQGEAGFTMLSMSCSSAFKRFIASHHG